MSMSGREYDLESLRLIVAGNALRAAQIERFTKAFPDATSVGPEQTGGGCVWFAVRFGHDGPFYILTDGEAELPEDDEGQAVPNGGWGCVAFYPPMSMDDDALRYLHLNAATNWRVGLRDEQAIELIRLHREGKLGDHAFSYDSYLFVEVEE